MNEAPRTAAMRSAVARKLKSIRTKAAMRYLDVANILGKRAETISRWNQGRTYPRSDTEKALVELEFVVDHLADLYAPTDARMWVFSPQKQLGGISPAELIRAGRFDDVRRLLSHLRSAG